MSDIRKDKLKVEEEIPQSPMKKPVQMMKDISSPWIKATSSIDILNKAGFENSTFDHNSPSKPTALEHIPQTISEVQQLLNQEIQEFDEATLEKDKIVSDLYALTRMENNKHNP